MKNYWLLKSEPETFSWDTLANMKKDHWDGVRNYQARNYMKSMKKGDLGFFYHSGKDKAIVGIVEITREAYPDPTVDDPAWVAVEVSAVRPLKNPVTLSTIKSASELSEMVLVKSSRLSVQPVTSEQFDYILKMAGE